MSLSSHTLLDCGGGAGTSILSSAEDSVFSIPVILSTSSVLLSVVTTVSDSVFAISSRHLD